MAVASQMKVVRRVAGRNVLRARGGEWYLGHMPSETGTSYAHVVFFIAACVAFLKHSWCEKECEGSHVKQLNFAGRGKKGTRIDPYEYPLMSLVPGLSRRESNVDVSTGIGEGRMAKIALPWATNRMVEWGLG